MQVPANAVEARGAPAVLAKRTRMDVTTLAGSSGGHQDGQGAAAKFSRIGGGVACCPDGSAFVTDGNRLRTLSAGGAVATFAGSGGAGCQDGQGTAARFVAPQQIARDAEGNLYVADCGNHRIRKVTPGGLVTTFAGTGDEGDADGTLSEASFNGPEGVAVCPKTGNIIVGDTGNHRIRVIDVANGTVHTLAGTSEPDFADGAGPAAKFHDPIFVACSANGTIYVADHNNNRVRKITVLYGGCTVTTLAGDGAGGHRDGAGAQARFDAPHGVAVDGDGNVLVTDYGGHRVRLVMPAGDTSTLAGNGTAGSADGQGTAALLSWPVGAAVDAAGNLLVCDGGNYRLRHVAAGLAPPPALRAPGPAAPAPEMLALADYGKLLDDAEDTFQDVAFLVGGETIRAHKAILAARCEYFDTMLNSGFAEGTGGAGATSGAATAPLPVEDTTPTAFRALLRFLYTGRVELEEASVLDVACLSQRYLVKELHDQCAECCNATVSLANAVPWLVAADTHALAGLRGTLLEYVAANLPEIEAAVPDTQAVLEGHPKLMYAVMRSMASPVPRPAKRRKASN